MLLYHTLRYPVLRCRVSAPDIFGAGWPFDAGADAAHLFNGVAQGHGGPSGKAADPLQGAVGL